MTISSLGSAKLTRNRRITIPPRIARELGVVDGEEISFFKDEYGRMIVQKNVAESILSTLEMPAQKSPVQKVFP